MNSFCNTENHQIDMILKQTKSIALIGASLKPERPSHSVMKALLEREYKVYPVNPGHSGSLILEQICYSRLSDIPFDIDMVDIFRPSKYVPDIVDEAIRCSVKTIWTQLDIIHEQAARKARMAGLNVIMNRCPKIEFRRQEGIV